MCLQLKVMYKRISIFLVLIAPFTLFLKAQVTPNEVEDSLFIAEFHQEKGGDKVLHAEPLYIDLIRDLGARKGEREWNVGMGLTDNLQYDSYEGLIEYEWAPINRLGLEVELPFNVYSSLPGFDASLRPASQLKSFKCAAQYTFYVNESNATSLAVGYINELNLYPQLTSNSYLKGWGLNPFFIAAKRWGNNLHTLLYTGPVHEFRTLSSDWGHKFKANLNFHYMIPGSKNFIGVEFNQSFEKDNFDMIIRPQMRVSVADNLLVGIVGGVPVSRKNERLSTFIRLIWEPKHKH